MINQHTILIVDDEATVREVLRRYLEADGFRVIEANTGPMALHLLYEEQPDLIVLDIMLPGLDGFTITRSIREPVGASGRLNTADGIPIIMLTARTDEADRITGFELGTDDYVTKPFSPRELIMRIKAVLRRSGVESDTNETSLIVAGELKLDANSRTVMRGDRNIPLTAKEFELLWYLAQHPRQVFNRAQLLDQVWGYQFFGDGSTVTVHIHRLREKIETDPSNPEYIHTVWGVGYKFEAPA